MKWLNSLATSQFPRKKQKQKQKNNPFPNQKGWVESISEWKIFTQTFSPPQNVKCKNAKDTDIYYQEKLQIRSLFNKGLPKDPQFWNRLYYSLRQLQFRSSNLIDTLKQLWADQSEGTVKVVVNTCSMQQNYIYIISNIEHTINICDTWLHRRMQRNSKMISNIENIVELCIIMMGRGHIGISNIMFEG